MSITQMVLRGHRASLLVALTFSAFACHYFSKTYDPQIPILYLPPGVNSEPSQFRAQAAMRPQGRINKRSRNGSRCNGCMVQIDIMALGNTQEVNPSPKAMPATGRPVAKIVNNDPMYFEDMYGFRPSSQFEYYVWADVAGTPPTARMTLLEVPADRRPGEVRAIFQKNLQICRDGHKYPPTTDADFNWCPGVHVSAGANVNHAGVTGTVPPFAAALLSRVSDFIAEMFTAPPLWLRCTDGCCG